MTNLKDYIREISDFPSEGIKYKDITPLLLDPEAVQETVAQFIKLIGDVKIDKVVGIESRGFFFGMLLAEKLKAGFVPIRKPGKLPFKIHAESYKLEYGTDVLEIHQDAIKPGENVILHDDVLATGGTAKAACSLIEKMGGNIIQCNFLIELDFLNGRKKIAEHEVKSLLSY